MDVDKVIAATLVLFYRALANGREEAIVPQGIITYIVRRYTDKYVADIIVKMKRRRFADHIEEIGNIKIKNKYYPIISIKKSVEEICDDECEKLIHNSRLRDLVIRMARCLFDESYCSDFTPAIRKLVKEFRKKYIRY